MLDKQSSNSVSATTQHFIESGDAVLQQAGENLSRVRTSIVKGLSTALKFGLGAVAEPKAFKAYTQEVISSTAAHITEQLEHGKTALEEKVSKVKASVTEAYAYAAENGRENLRDVTEGAKAQLKEGLEYLKMEAVDFPISLARRAIANQAIDLQSGVQVGTIKLGTTALIEGLQVSRDDKNYLLSLYSRELTSIHEATKNSISALDLDNGTGQISRYDYITARGVVQKDFSDRISKLQGDVAEVVEAVSVEVARNQLRFNQRNRKAEYTAEGKGSQYEAGNYVKTIDKYWTTAREAKTHDIPQWARSVAGY
jgi:sRNA-binding protein